MRWQDASPNDKSGQTNLLFAKSIIIVVLTRVYLELYDLLSRTLHLYQHKQSLFKQDLDRDFRLLRLIAAVTIADSGLLR